MFVFILKGWCSSIFLCSCYGKTQNMWNCSKYRFLWSTQVAFWMCCFLALLEIILMSFFSNGRRGHPPFTEFCKLPFHFYVVGSLFSSWICVCADRQKLIKSTHTKLYLVLVFLSIYLCVCVFACRTIIETGLNYA